MFSAIMQCLDVNMLCIIYQAFIKQAFLKHFSSNSQAVIRHVSVIKNKYKPLLCPWLTFSANFVIGHIMSLHVISYHTDPEMLEN
jgi:hypothetical protein